jgi:hypothetical protein
MTTVTENVVQGIMPPAPTLCLHEGCRRLQGHDGEHEILPVEAWAFLATKDQQKLSKAGYATPRGGKKGAYQNHVYRNNKVIVPYERLSQVDLADFLDGYVVRLFPEQYFSAHKTPKPEFLEPNHLVEVGTNAFVLYRSHESYANLPPLDDWEVRYLRNQANEIVQDRRGVVTDHGHYILRLPKANGNEAKDAGPPQGIFAPEYADEETNYLCQCVLAWLMVHCDGSPYTTTDAGHLRAILRNSGLEDTAHFERRGVLRHALTSCPLCNRLIGYGELHQTVSFDDTSGLENAALQVEGITRSTIVNLFHLEPLGYNSLSHIPKNIAWGHATCNTKLGQRHCYSLAELIDMNLKVGIIRQEGVETFGWISDDMDMIRSNGGSVWVRLVEDGQDEVV